MGRQQVILIKYGEISLRKGNRPLFEKSLINKIRSKIDDSEKDYITVVREQGRLIVKDSRGNVNHANLLPKIKCIFGITAICLCAMLDYCDINELQEVALTFFVENTTPQPFTYKIETKRGNKLFPLTSREVSTLVGGHIDHNLGHAKVDVHNPEYKLWIEIRTNIYIYMESVIGAGGLPYGSSGKGVLLLSGGIDSPVAGYLCARKGVELVSVYFHSPPHTSERVVDKVYDLVLQLVEYTGEMKLYIIPFTDIQLFLYEHVQHEKLTLLLKRAMLRIATIIAENESARSLVTGDSIGQVASQTIQSLDAVNSAAGFPILRPLASMDKQDIINYAKRINTYDISIRPYDDCCTLFVAKHPEVKPKTSVIEKIEDRHRILTDMYKIAVQNAEVVYLPLVNNTNF